jgi:hypothetical protein
MESTMKSQARLFFASALLTAAVATTTAHAQTYSQLGTLPGTMEGMPLVNSNNPESVSREGLLLASEPMVSADAGKVSRTLSTGTGYGLLQRRNARVCVLHASSAGGAQRW